jgi:hypothetical protein
VSYISPEDQWLEQEKKALSRQANAVKVLLLLLSVAGLAYVVYWSHEVLEDIARFDSIKCGMTEKEVKAILGEPTDVQKAPHIVNWLGSSKGATRGPCGGSTVAQTFMYMRSFWRESLVLYFGEDGRVCRIQRITFNIQDTT